MFANLTRVPFALALIVANTLLHGLPLLALAVVKLLLPLPTARRRVSQWLICLAERWVDCNNALLRRLTPTRIDIEGDAGLRPDSWYLVLANHQSWVDILILQFALNRRIPFLKFFLKQQLIWVPLLGLTWWALDFPFMRRYSKALLARRPELRGRDKEATRRACQRFRELPVSIVNFVEGTRFSPAKQQRAPGYRHLLRPKAGGVAFVLETMGEQLHAVLDVTIAYPAGAPSVTDLLAGRVDRICVSMRQRPIPSPLIGRDYEQDGEFRQLFQHWLNQIWAEKDAHLQALRGPAAPVAPPLTERRPTV